jgi:hypothetical protein
MQSMKCRLRSKCTVFAEHARDRSTTMGVVGRTVLLGILLAACDSSRTSIAWTFRFETPATRARVSAIEARIRTGGCTSEETRYRVAFRLGETGPLPPEIGGGRWGFEIRAVDADCAVIAQGCEDVELGEATAVDVLLIDRAEPSVCPAGRCDRGVCGTLAPPDAGSDAGSVDAALCGTCQLDNAVPTCSASGCAIAECLIPFADCDGIAANGCELVCPVRPNTNVACRENRCIVAGCVDGFSDCDGDAKNGCEQAGTCSCPEGMSCAFNCANGCEVDCDGRCTVMCGACTTCSLTCRNGNSCSIACAPGDTRSGSSSTVWMRSCELEDTCR